MSISQEQKKNIDKTIKVNRRQCRLVNNNNIQYSCINSFGFFLFFCFLQTFGVSFSEIENYILYADIVNRLFWFEINHGRELSFVCVGFGIVIGNMHGKPV